MGIGKDKVTGQQGEQGARTNKVRVTETLDVALQLSGETVEGRDSRDVHTGSVVFAVELDVACALKSESPRWHHPCEEEHRTSL